MAIVQINIELRTKSFAGSYSHNMTLSILYNERDNSILDFIHFLRSVRHVVLFKTYHVEDIQISNKGLLGQQ